MTSINESLTYKLEKLAGYKLNIELSITQLTNLINNYEKIYI